MQLTAGWSNLHLPAVTASLFNFYIRFNSYITFILAQCTKIVNSNYANFTITLVFNNIIICSTNANNENISK